MQTKRLFQVFSLMLVGILLISACTPAATQAPAPAATSAPAATAAPAATSAPAATAAPAATGKIVIGAVLFGSDSFFENIQNGMESAAKDAGAQLLVNVHNHDIAKETTFIEDYIARKVNAIVITPESTDASVAAIKQAFDAGIKIICFNTCINDTDAAKYVSAFYETDQASLGQQTGEYLAGWLAKNLAGQDVNVGILNCDKYEACKQRGAGFRKALTDKGVKWTEVSNQEGFMPDVGSTVAESMLQANPKINVLWSENEGGTVGEVIAVRTMALIGKVFVFGTDISPQLADMLTPKENILQAVTGQSPRGMGGDSIKAAIMAVNGQKNDYHHIVANAFYSRDDQTAVQQYLKDYGAPATEAAPAATAVPAAAPTQAAASGAPVTLVYWRAGGVGTVALSDKSQAVVNAFEAANPNIKIEAQIVPFPEYDQKELTSLTAKEGPDVLEINSVSLGLFTSKGLVYPIDDLVAKSSTIKKDQFYPGGWQTGVYQGKLWGLPLDTGTRIILYNKDLFKAAGVKEFGKTVTWPELLEAAKKITDKQKGIYGWGYFAGERWGALYEGIGHFAIQNNAKFISDDMTQVTVNSPEMLETFKFYKELSQYAPPDAVNWNVQQNQEQLFLDGKLGMYIAGFWSLDGVLKSNPNINYGLSAPMNKVAGSSTGGWLISMPAYLSGAKLEAAWKFMEWVFKPENNAAWTDLMPNQPASVSLTLQDKRYDIFKEILPASRHPIPLHPGLPDMADAIQVELQKYLLDQQTAEQTLATLQTKLEAILKK